LLKDIVCGECGYEVEIDLTANDTSSKCPKCSGALTTINPDDGMAEISEWVQGRFAHIAKELDELAGKLEEIDDSRALAFVDNAITAIYLARGGGNGGESGNSNNLFVGGDNAGK